MIIGGITLPNPEFRNSKNLTGNLVIHTMMNGDKKTHIDVSSKEIHIINISNIKKFVVDSLLTYLDSNIGNTIAITDWDNVAKNIKIVSTPLIFTSENRGVSYYTSEQNVDERYVIELEYEIV